MKRLFVSLILSFVPLGSLYALPSANLQVIPSTGDLSTNFTIDARQSQNTQGSSQHLQYRFKPSQNTPLSAYSRNPIFKFKATKTGNFKAQLMVLDTNTGGVSTNFFNYRVRQQIQREVRIEASNLNPTEGEEVVYRVIVFGSNINRQKIKTRWDFNSDGHFETSFKNTLTGSYAAQVGLSSPTVEVEFEDGQVIKHKGIYARGKNPSRNRISRRQAVKINTSSSALKPPVLQISPGLFEANQNTYFTFDGSKTKRVNGSYLEWLIEGKIIKNKTVVQHRFSASGKQKIVLRHCLNQQQPLCLERQGVVNINQSPNDQYLNIHWNNLTDTVFGPKTSDYAHITVTDQVRFNAQTLGQSTPGQTFKYRWDFDGNGTFDTSYSSYSHAQHQFNQVGEFMVTVEVLPALTSANFTRLTHQIPVYVNPNRAPTGSFDFSKNGHYVGERVYYTATTNDPQSGQNLQVRFDSDADGVWDSEFRKQKSWWWVYEEPGTYPVKMQVKDPHGALTEVVKNMTIKAMPLPQAGVEVSHRRQVVGKNIRLDASKSTGRYLTYQWMVLEQPEKVWFGERSNLKLEVGDYTVRLIIRDRLGISQQTDFPISFVEANTPTVANKKVGAVTNNSNMLKWLPGAPKVGNYIIPTQGVERGPSPFLVEAGAPSSNYKAASEMMAR